MISESIPCLKLGDFFTCEVIQNDKRVLALYQFETFIVKLTDNDKKSELKFKGFIELE